jgi:hypothetical protein
VAEEVASHYPPVRPGKWWVVEQQEARSQPGAQPVDIRRVFSVKGADDEIFSSETKAEASAVAEALNFVEADKK